MLADIEELVRCESPSADLDAVAASAGVVAGLGQRLLGAQAERIVIDRRNHLRWRLGDGPDRVLLLAHHDTVWPLGSLRAHPFAVTGGVLCGPGCFDMKTGLVLALHATAVLRSAGGGAHADDEHVLVDALPGRAALVAALLSDLLGRAVPDD